MTLCKGATEFVITCDHPGCNEECVHHTYTKEEARAVFREKGWWFYKNPKTWDEECYCPRHNGKGANE